MKSRHTFPFTKNDPPAFFSADVSTARRFYLNLNPTKSQKLAVICGGLEHCTVDYAIHRASFPFYSIEYVARGSGELKLKGHTYLLQPGRVFSYGPGVAHDMAGDRKESLVKYFVDFAGQQAPAILRSCGLTAGSVAQVFPPHILSPLFDELIQSGLAIGRANPLLCAKLLECVALKIAGATTALEEAETLAFDTYLQCRRHIEEHYPRLQTLEQIAKQCHVNKAYLCRLFGRYHHQSPYQYLLRLKINQAAALLQPGLLVKQVAQQMGFDDAFHFSRVFRRIHGVWPSAFRRLRQ